MWKLCLLTIPRATVCAVLLLAAALVAIVSPACATVIPTTHTTALDGHEVVLPRDLPPATVLILGFSRHSVDATTAWERPTRTQLAQTPAITFYDMAMLADVPRLARGLVLGRVHKAVPDVLKPNFLPLLDHEAEWKQAFGFDPQQEDAAYVLLVDRSGTVHWSTHEPFSSTLFAQLTQAAQALSASPR